MTRTALRIRAGLLVFLTLPTIGLVAQPDDRASMLPEWEDRKDGEYGYVVHPDDPLGARYYQLENGLRVILSVNPAEPRIQTLIAVRAGSKHDPADNTGLAHYLEHMLFKGTDRYGTADWEKEKRELAVIEDLYDRYNRTTDAEERKRIYQMIDSVSGIAATWAIANEYDRMLGMIGASGTNAFTSTEQTVYMNDIPSNQIERWLRIEGERFRNPVFRLFHTELEAVYEEKNRALDSDGNQLWEQVAAALYRTHPYGTQTTIGTVEHLKNPSLKKIRQYYDTYYVPNNMAIIMAGDLDPGETIRMIDRYFGRMEQREVPVFTFAPEETRSEPTVVEVVGPEAPEVILAWRLPGAGSREALMAEMTDLLLAYKGAGMIDLELVQSQQLKSAGSYVDAGEDYSAQFLYGTPKEGQTLEEVRDLLLATLERIRTGDFDEEMMSGIIRNMEVDRLQSYRQNGSRAFTLLDSWVTGVNPMIQFYRTDIMRRLSKQDIVDFVNRWYTEDYVIGYKRVGQRQVNAQVEKPPITPVSVNREDSSPFVDSIATAAAPPIEPVFIDYREDITRRRLNGERGPELLYVENDQDELFELYYHFAMGSDNDPLLPYAVDYLEYIGTDEMSPEELRQAFFGLGCTYSVSSGRDQVWVSLSGPEESFEQALALFEKFLAKAEGDDESLEGLVSLVLQQREETKTDKSALLFRGLASYAVYGEENPVTEAIEAEDLKDLEPEDLTDRLHDLTSWKHTVLYYGPRPISSLASTLERYHQIPEDGVRDYPAAREWERREIEETTIWFLDFDMVQAEVVWLRDVEPYNPESIALRSLFNEYFGGGMSSIVFQEIRESKALAYSTFSGYRSPNDPSEPHTIMSYIGTQADKLPEAMRGMNELHDDLPRAPGNLAAAREAIRNKYATERILRSGILFDYLQARRFDLAEDTRRVVYTSIDGITLDDLVAFHRERYAGKPYAICVIGSKESVDLEKLGRFGRVVEVEINDIMPE